MQYGCSCAAPISDQGWTQVTVQSILANVLWDLFDTTISSLALLETPPSSYPRTLLTLAQAADRHPGQVSQHPALAVWKKWSSCPERDAWPLSGAHLSLLIRGRGWTTSSDPQAHHYTAEVRWINLISCDQLKHSHFSLSSVTSTWQASSTAGEILVISHLLSDLDFSFYCHTGAPVYFYQLPPSSSSHTKPPCVTYAANLSPCASLLMGSEGRERR